MPAAPRPDKQAAPNEMNDNGRLFVTGDLHGCVSELETLLQHIQPAKGDRFVFLGDYIDRGPHSRQVVDALLDLHGRPGLETIFLKGNHEDMFLDYIGEPGHGGHGFLPNGGRATLHSYGLAADCSHERLMEVLPGPHLRFFRELGLYYHEPRLDLFCVHAGIRPTRPLEEQETLDLLWIRGDFIHHPHPLPFTVAFGHTPAAEVLFDLPYKVGLDTGLVFGGQLSCLEWSQKLLLQVPRGSHRVQTREVSQQWQ